MTRPARTRRPDPTMPASRTLHFRTAAPEHEAAICATLHGAAGEPTPAFRASWNPNPRRLSSLVDGVAGGSPRRCITGRHGRSETGRGAGCAQRQLAYRPPFHWRQRAEVRRPRRGGKSKLRTWRSGSSLLGLPSGSAVFWMCWLRRFGLADATRGSNFGGDILRKLAAMADANTPGTMPSGSPVASQTETTARKREDNIDRSTGSAPAEAQFRAHARGASRSCLHPRGLLIEASREIRRSSACQRTDSFPNAAWRKAAGQPVAACSDPL
jgi:hypothetical protein